MACAHAGFVRFFSPRLCIFFAFLPLRISIGPQRAPIERQFHVMEAHRVIQIEGSDEKGGDMPSVLCGPRESGARCGEVSPLNNAESVPQRVFVLYFSAEGVVTC